MKIRIAIFVDALGFEIVKKYNFFEELTYRRPVQMQFGYSSTALPTILTGKKPKEHGHFTMFHLNKETSPFKNSLMKPLKLFPSKLEQNWRIRNVVSRCLKQFYNFSGYLNIYSIPIKKLEKLDISEKRNIFLEKGFDNTENVSDILKARGEKFFMSNYEAAESENISALKKSISEKEIEFAFLYTAQLDSLLHVQSKDGEGIKDKLRWYEEQFKDVIELANKKYDDVEVMLFSDHGMTTYTESFDVQSILKSTGLTEGVDYDVLLDATIARFWYYNDSAKEIIRKSLNADKIKHIQPEQLIEWGCDFEGDKYGEDFYLVDPGVQIVPNDFGKKPLKGMHGYTPEHKDSNACFLANFEPEKDPQWVGDFFDLMVG